MDRWRSVRVGQAGRRRLLEHLLVIGVVVAVALAAAGAADARPADQGGPTPPTTDQGPRYGNWGPGQSPPAPEGPLGGETQAPAAPAQPGARPDAAPGAAPSAPSPYAAPGPNPSMPAPAPPAPDRWGGCNYDLRGSWQIMGSQTSPYQRPYSSNIRVRQYRNWLQIDQPQDNVSYYGQCNGDQLTLDVYQSGQFVGYQDGTVSWSSGWGPGPWASTPPWDGPDWSGPRPRFGGWGGSRGQHVTGSWVMFSPSYAAGQETWVRW